MEQVLGFIKRVKTYYIATVDGEQARVRPLGTITKFEDKLYFQTGKVKSFYAQLKANPKIEISAADSEGFWIRLEATAVEDDRLEAREAVLDDYPGLKNMYAADDGNCVVFYLKDATATFCSFTNPPETIKF